MLVNPLSQAPQTILLWVEKHSQVKNNTTIMQIIHTGDVVAVDINKITVEVVAADSTIIKSITIRNHAIGEAVEK